MKIKIAICDDDITIHKQLSEIIIAYSINHNKDIETCYFNSPNELLKRNLKYDILFLDIRFAQKDIGINVAKQLRCEGNESIIIIITTLTSKAIEGYEVGAYRYIVKPIKKEALFSILDSAINKIKNSSSVIFVKQKYDTEIISINSIQCIQSNKRKRIVYTSFNQVETWDTLKSIFDQLPKEQFTYIQKSCIVNFNKIASIRKNEITLESGIKVPVSRHLKQEFFSLYFDYVGK